MQDQGAPVATAEWCVDSQLDRWFYIGMAICAIIVSVSGFAPSLVNTPRVMCLTERHTQI